MEIKLFQEHTLLVILRKKCVSAGIDFKSNALKTIACMTIVSVSF